MEFEKATLTNSIRYALKEQPGLTSNELAAILDEPCDSISKTLSYLYSKNELRRKKLPKTKTHQPFLSIFSGEQDSMQNKKLGTGSKTWKVFLTEETFVEVHAERIIIKESGTLVFFGKKEPHIYNKKEIEPILVCFAAGSWSVMFANLDTKDE